MAELVLARISANVNLEAGTDWISPGAITAGTLWAIASRYSLGRGMSMRTTGSLSLWRFLGTCMQQDSPLDEIAHTAARLAVEEGLDWGPAKRRALRELGLPARTALPDNDRVEDAVREYISLFCADSQPFELRALRCLALEWMERMVAFRPHLSGAVWRGTATRLSDIYLQLFCDDCKSAEIALINHHVEYDPSTVAGFNGQSVEALSLAAMCPELDVVVGVHLLVYDLDDLRGALKPDSRGRSPRGDAAAVRLLLRNENSLNP